MTNWTPIPGQCRVGWPFNNCPRGQTCWRYRIGTDNWNGNGICVPHNRCLPTNTWARRLGYENVRAMANMCCNGSRLRCNGGSIRINPYCVCEGLWGLLNHQLIVLWTCFVRNNNNEVSFRDWKACMILEEEYNVWSFVDRVMVG